MPVLVVSSASALARLDAARDAIRALPAAAAALLVGATRAAADEAALAVAAERGALMGVHRASFSELAMTLALPALARRGLSPGGALGWEAIATRAAFEANAAGELEYFAPVADLPGFPRAAARTLADLQLAGVGAEALSALDEAGRDLAVLSARAHEEARQAGTVMRAEVWAAAAERVRTSPSALAATDIVFLDVAVTSVVEEAFLAAVVGTGARVLGIVPAGDNATLEAYRRAGAREVVSPPRPSAAPAVDAVPPVDEAPSVDAAPSQTALARLHTWLFSTDAPPVAALDESVQVFSAPGEGREAVEIARRVLLEASRGVPFDQMAVLLRAPQTYFGLLEHALSRAGVPAWFERGTRRPDPAGRALLALLACADEGLSARRFAEYLSLGQVPSLPDAASDAMAAGPSAAAAVGAVATDDMAGALVAPGDRPEDPAPLDEAPAVTERDGDRVVAGTLRAPWKWEELIVEACVIKGLDRWKRRLPGLRREYERRLREVGDDDRDSPRLRLLERQRAELQHLESFGIPIIETLDGWRTPRTWGAWLRDIEALVPRVLRQPARVLRVIAEMAPLESVGPVSLREVRAVLAPRLLTLTHEPPRRRGGHVFVGTPHAARGRVFRVVFVPGLAERIFPQRLREDPLLLDSRRARLDSRLRAADARADEERLQLRLAVGAAAERAYLSYPRVEVSESRPRVPSFYVLDVMRAMTGTIPGYAALSEQAFAAGSASLAWPAPPDPASAIDDMEHDLAVLGPLLRAVEREGVEGRARYLLDLSPSLKRSVTERWLRWQRRWSYADGLVRAQQHTRPALDRHRLAARPYSLTALQRYASCPYQFQLAAIYRLAPLEEPAPLQRLDPLTRGSLFHEIQAEMFGRLRDNGLLPVTEERLGAARGVLDWAIGRVTARAYDDLAPAIDRVWRDEVAALTRDLRVWLDHLARDGREWVPERFELAFGLPPDGRRDAASTPEPAQVGPGFLLRGSIDLVERRIADAGGRPPGRTGAASLRVTDHKTGRNRTTLATIVDGGRVLQPVLYAVALEALTGETVEVGRLSYCTAAGRFTEHPIALDPLIRRRGIEVLEIVDRAIESGMLASRPARDACRYCDFRAVCGPDEERRTARKPAVPDLDALRKLP